MKKMMMMLVMATIALTASAQNTLRDNGTFTLQPKVGIGIGLLSGEWKSVSGVDNKSRVGLVAGVEGEYYATEWLGIALGVNYAQQGWKFKGNDLDETTKLDYLNVPLTGNFYVAKGLALKTGFQFGFLMSAKVESEDVKDACEKLNLSIPLGISYEISNFVLDLRYNMGLNKTNKADNGNKARSDLLQITLGYKFAL
ncbi:MAG: PorT family protein [Prevotella sp.]|nr:PorT family protein [Prevotella sp.]